MVLPSRFALAASVTGSLGGMVEREPRGLHVAAVKIPGPSDERSSDPRETVSTSGADVFETTRHQVETCDEDCLRAISRTDGRRQDSDVVAVGHEGSDIAIHAR